MNRIGFVLALLSLAACLGCAPVMDRETTTEDSAIEQALLTQSLQKTIDSLKIPQGEPRTFFVNSEGVEAEEGKYLAHALSEQLLLKGYQASTEAEAELIVYPRVEFNNIDDNTILIGIPNLQSQIVEVPEIALYRSYNQRGRSQVSVYGIERETGDLAFNTEADYGEYKYNRYTLLLLFQWRTTDLPAPFSSEPKR